MLNRLNRVLTNFEMGFNFAECLPFGIGGASGVIRANLGTIQAITGLGVAAIGLVGQHVSRNEKRKWERVKEIGCEQAYHGALNILRGLTASAISDLTLGMGNLLLLIPNLSKDRPFSPYEHYGQMGHPRYYKDFPEEVY